MPPKSKKVLTPVSDLDIAEYNKKIIECIHSNQDEINYRLNGKLDYQKKIQRRSLKEDDKFKELEAKFLSQPTINLKEKLPFISSSVCVPLKITYVILYVYNTV